MKKAVVGSVILAMVFTLSWVLMKHPASDVPSSQQKPDSEVQKTSQVLSPQQTAAAKPTSIHTGPSLGSNSVPQSQGSLSPSSSNPAAQPLPRETAQELKGFRVLHGKTFLTTEEEKRKQALLQNSALIRDLGSLLSQPAYMSDPQFEAAENAALDLLLESFQRGDRATSLEVIQSLIQDQQVENGQLPQSIRETLAGIKGELLYNAVALAPQEFKSTVQNLPGPVSQRIWQNVQEKHRQNLAESQLEAQEHASKASQR